MKLLHHLSFVLRTTNDNEMKKNEFDFVKMKFYLNKNYVEWICILQVELNAIQLNLNLIKISKIEFKHIDWNSNFVELNQAQYSFSLDSIRLMFPLNFNWIEFSWIESYWIWSIQIGWIQPNYENSITKKKMLICLFMLSMSLKLKWKLTFKNNYKQFKAPMFNLIDHIKHYCCRVNKHKVKPQNPILFFVCLLH
jgi:hypothetical protein